MFGRLDAGAKMIALRRWRSNAGARSFKQEPLATRKGLDYIFPAFAEKTLNRPCHIELPAAFSGRQEFNDGPIRTVGPDC